MKKSLAFVLLIGACSMRAMEQQQICAITQEEIDSWKSQSYPLHRAVHNGDETEVRELIEKFPGIFFDQDSFGNRPIDVAISCCRKGGPAKYAAYMRIAAILSPSKC